MSAGRELMLEERIIELERLMLYLLALEYRRSKLFLSANSDGVIGKEELDKFRAQLKEKMPI